MAIHIRRRELLTALGSAATWPVVARAQQAAMPVIGFLHSTSPEPNANLVTAFRKGLVDRGFIEGKNVAIEYRWAEGQVDRLPDLAADLVHRKVAVIVTPGSTPAALAAKAATATIPIVFAVGADPVTLGLVASLNRPGGNVTGVAFESTEIAGKALGLLREVLPQAARVVAIVNPESVFTGAVVKNLEAGASTLRLQVEIAFASSDRAIEAAFTNNSQRPGTALLVGPDALYTSHRVKIVALAARYARCPRCIACANSPTRAG